MLYIFCIMYVINLHIKLAFGVFFLGGLKVFFFFCIWDSDLKFVIHVLHYVWDEIADGISFQIYLFICTIKSVQIYVRFSSFTLHNSSVPYQTIQFKERIAKWASFLNTYFYIGTTVFKWWNPLVFSLINVC